MDRNKYMDLLYQKHKDWIDISKSFGLDEETAKDLVSEMYIKIMKKLDKGLDISYGSADVNYYYIFKTLRTMFIDLVRKNKNVTIIRNYYRDGKADSFIDYESKWDLIQKELEDCYWYDRKVFELINGGYSIAELSRKSGIPYYSLYNTYNKIKEKIKDLL